MTIAPDRPEMLAPTAGGIDRAAAILSSGGLVAFPTETVYGLAADARNDVAVARVFEAKGRPSFNPLIVHVPDLDAARSYVTFTPEAERLAGAFWPGALTLVLPLRPGAGLSPLVTAGLETLAVRVPDHPTARALLTAFGGPVAAPSANPSGKVSPTRAEHVAQGLAERVDAVLDGGPCPVGLESTIIGFDPAPRLLRAGGLPLEAIGACLGAPIAERREGEAITAPGQIASHYAPDGQIRLDVVTPEEGEVLLGFGPVEAPLNLSPSGDMVEAAARLFECLHRLNEMGANRIAVSPIPDHGLGRAINDRLRRAAAPRG